MQYFYGDLDALRAAATDDAGMKAYNDALSTYMSVTATVYADGTVPETPIKFTKYDMNGNLVTGFPYYYDAVSLSEYTRRLNIVSLLKGNSDMQVLYGDLDALRTLADADNASENTKTKYYNTIAAYVATAIFVEEHAGDITRTNAAGTAIKLTTYTTNATVDYVTWTEPMTLAEYARQLDVVHNRFIGNDDFESVFGVTFPTQDEIVAEGTGRETQYAVTQRIGAYFGAARMVFVDNVPTTPVYLRSYNDDGSIDVANSNWQLPVSWDEYDRQLQVVRVLKNDADFQALFGAFPALLTYDDRADRTKKVANAKAIGRYFGVAPIIFLDAVPAGSEYIKVYDYTSETDYTVSVLRAVTLSEFQRQLRVIRQLMTLEDFTALYGEFNADDTQVLGAYFSAAAFVELPGDPVSLPGMVGNLIPNPIFDAQGNILLDATQEPNKPLEVIGLADYKEQLAVVRALLKNSEFKAIYEISDIDETAFKALIAQQDKSDEDITRLYMISGLLFGAARFIMLTPGQSLDQRKITVLGNPGEVFDGAVAEYHTYLKVTIDEYVESLRIIDDYLLEQIGDRFIGNIFNGNTSPFDFIRKIMSDHLDLTGAMTEAQNDQELLSLFMGMAQFITIDGGLYQVVEVWNEETGRFERFEKVDVKEYVRRFKIAVELLQDSRYTQFFIFENRALLAKYPELAGETGDIVNLLSNSDVAGAALATAATIGFGRDFASVEDFLSVIPTIRQLMGNPDFLLIANNGYPLDAYNSSDYAKLVAIARFIGNGSGRDPEKLYGDTDQYMAMVVTKILLKDKLEELLGIMLDTAINVRHDAQIEYLAREVSRGVNSLDEARAKLDIMIDVMKNFGTMPGLKAEFNDRGPAYELSLHRYIVDMTRFDNTAQSSSFAVSQPKHFTRQPILPGETKDEYYFKRFHDGELYSLGVISAYADDLIVRAGGYKNITTVNGKATIPADIVENMRAMLQVKDLLINLGIEGRYPELFKRDDMFYEGFKDFLAEQKILYNADIDRIVEEPITGTERNMRIIRKKPVFIGSRDSLVRDVPNDDLKTLDGNYQGLAAAFGIPADDMKYYWDAYVDYYTKGVISSFAESIGNELFCFDKNTVDQWEKEGKTSQDIKRMQKEITIKFLNIHDLVYSKRDIFFGTTGDYRSEAHFAALDRAWIIYAKRGLYLDDTQLMKTKEYRNYVQLYNDTKNVEWIKKANVFAFSKDLLEQQYNGKIKDIDEFLVLYEFTVKNKQALFNAFVDKTSAVYMDDAKNGSIEKTIQRLAKRGISATEADIAQNQEFITMQTRMYNSLLNDDTWFVNAKSFAFTLSLAKNIEIGKLDKSQLGEFVRYYGAIGLIANGVMPEKKGDVFDFYAYISAREKALYYTVRRYRSLTIDTVRDIAVKPATALIASERPVRAAFDALFMEYYGDDTTPGAYRNEYGWYRESKTFAYAIEFMKENLPLNEVKRRLEVKNVIVDATAPVDRNDDYFAATADIMIFTEESRLNADGVVLSVDDKTRLSNAYHDDDTWFIEFKAMPTWKALQNVFHLALTDTDDMIRTRTEELNQKQKDFYDPATHTFDAFKDADWAENTKNRDQRFEEAVKYKFEMINNDLAAYGVTLPPDLADTIRTVYQKNPEVLYAGIPEAMFMMYDDLDAAVKKSIELYNATPKIYVTNVTGNYEDILKEGTSSDRNDESFKIKYIRQKDFSNTAARQRMINGVRRGLMRRYEKSASFRKVQDSPEYRGLMEIIVRPTVKELERSLGRPLSPAEYQKQVDLLSNDASYFINTQIVTTIEMLINLGLTYDDASMVDIVFEYLDLVTEELNGGMSPESKALFDISVEKATDDWLNDYKTRNPESAALLTPRDRQAVRDFFAKNPILYQWANAAPALNFLSENAGVNLKYLRRNAQAKPFTGETIDNELRATIKRWVATYKEGLDDKLAAAGDDEIIALTRLWFGVKKDEPVTFDKYCVPITAETIKKYPYLGGVASSLALDMAEYGWNEKELHTHVQLYRQILSGQNARVREAMIKYYTINGDQDEIIAGFDPTRSDVLNDVELKKEVWGFYGWILNMIEDIHHQPKKGPYDNSLEGLTVDAVVNTLNELMIIKKYSMASTIAVGQCIAYVKENYKKTLSGKEAETLLIDMHTMTAKAFAKKYPGVVQADMLSALREYSLDWSAEKVKAFYKAYYYGDHAASAKKYLSESGTNKDEQWKKVFGDIVKTQKIKLDARRELLQKKFNIDTSAQQKIETSIRKLRTMGLSDTEIVTLIMNGNTMHEQEIRKKYFNTADLYKAYQAIHDSTKVAFSVIDTIIGAERQKYNREKPEPAITWLDADELDKYKEIIMQIIDLSLRDLDVEQAIYFATEYHYAEGEKSSEQIKDEFKDELYIQAVYKTFNKDEDGNGRELNLGALGSKLTEIEGGRATVDEVVKAIRYEAFVRDQLHYLLLYTVAKGMDEKHMSEFMVEEKKIDFKELFNNLPPEKKEMAEEFYLLSRGGLSGFVTRYVLEIGRSKEEIWDYLKDFVYVQFFAYQSLHRYIDLKQMPSLMMDVRDWTDPLYLNKNNMWKLQKRFEKVYTLKNAYRNLMDITKVDWNTLIKEIHAQSEAGEVMRRYIDDERILADIDRYDTLSDERKEKVHRAILDALDRIIMNKADYERVKSLYPPLLNDQRWIWWEIIGGLPGIVDDTAVDSIVTMTQQVPNSVTNIKNNITQPDEQKKYAQLFDSPNEMQKLKADMVDKYKSFQWQVMGDLLINYMWNTTGTMFDGKWSDAIGDDIDSAMRSMAPGSIAKIQMREIHMEEMTKRELAESKILEKYATAEFQHRQAAKAEGRMGKYQRIVTQQAFKEYFFNKLGLMLPDGTARYFQQKVATEGYDYREICDLYVTYYNEIANFYGTATGKKVFGQDDRGIISSYAEMLFKSWGYISLLDDKTKANIENEFKTNKQLHDARTIDERIEYELSVIQAKINMYALLLKHFHRFGIEISNSLASSLASNAVRAGVIYRDDIDRWFALAEAIYTRTTGYNFETGVYENAGLVNDANDPLRYGMSSDDKELRKKESGELFNSSRELHQRQQILFTVDSWLELGLSKQPDNFIEKQKKQLKTNDAVRANDQIVVAYNEVIFTALNQLGVTVYDAPVLAVSDIRRWSRFLEYIAAADDEDPFLGRIKAGLSDATKKRIQDVRKLSAQQLMAAQNEVVRVLNTMGSDTAYAVSLINSGICSIEGNDHLARMLQSLQDQEIVSKDANGQYVISDNLSSQARVQLQWFTLDVMNATRPDMFRKFVRNDLAVDTYPSMGAYIKISGQYVTINEIRESMIRGNMDPSAILTLSRRILQYQAYINTGKTLQEQMHWWDDTKARIGISDISNETLLLYLDYSNTDVRNRIGFLDIVARKKVGDGTSDERIKKEKQEIMEDTDRYIDKSVIAAFKNIVDHAIDNKVYSPRQNENRWQRLFSLQTKEGESGWRHLGRFAIMAIGLVLLSIINKIFISKKNTKMAVDDKGKVKYADEREETPLPVQPGGPGGGGSDIRNTSEATTPAQDEVAKKEAARSAKLAGVLRTAFFVGLAVATSGIMFETTMAVVIGSIVAAIAGILMLAFWKKLKLSLSAVLITSLLLSVTVATGGIILGNMLAVTVAAGAGAITIVLGMIFWKKFKLSFFEKSNLYDRGGGLVILYKGILSALVYFDTFLFFSVLDHFSMSPVIVIINILTFIYLNTTINETFLRQIWDAIQPDRMKSLKAAIEDKDQGGKIEESIKEYDRDNPSIVDPHNALRVVIPVYEDTLETMKVVLDQQEMAIRDNLNPNIGLYYILQAGAEKQDVYAKNTDYFYKWITNIWEKYGTEMAHRFNAEAFKTIDAMDISEEKKAEKKREVEEQYIARMRAQVVGFVEMGGNKKPLNYQAAAIPSTGPIEGADQNR